MNGLPIAMLWRLCAAGLLLPLAGGCGLLLPAAVPQPSFYSLDRRPDALPAAKPPAMAPTLVVNPSHAAAGFDSRRIIYAREPHRLEYFAHNEWVDTPARMIAPLIVAAAESSGMFRAVVLTPSAAAGDLRLDTEIVRLQHDFRTRPSRVHFTLRAHIVNNSTRQVLAWREFDQTVLAGSEDPYGGVVAANRAVQAALEQLASLCVEAASRWHPKPAGNAKRTAGE